MLNVYGMNGESRIAECKMNEWTVESKKFQIKNENFVVKKIKKE